jgi:hypothetical protein
MPACIRASTGVSRAQAEWRIVTQSEQRYRALFEDIPGFNLGGFSDVTLSGSLKEQVQQIFAHI